MYKIENIDRLILKTQKILIFFDWLHQHFQRNHPHNKLQEKVDNSHLKNEVGIITGVQDYRLQAHRTP